jgi:hypothetical protein
MPIGCHHSTFLALIGTSLVASCVITFLILFHEYTRVCISLVHKPVPRKSHDVIIILSSFQHGRGHFDPFEGTDGCLFFGTDGSPTPHPSSVSVVRG